MKQVNAADLTTSLTTDDILIDVREPDEFVQAHVPGARLVPLSRIGASLGELPRETRVYVVCASGNRSAAMTEMLLARGFEAANVVGGTNAWIRAGRPVARGADLGTGAGAPR